MIGRHHHRPEFTQGAHPGNAQCHRQSQARERKGDPPENRPGPLSQQRRVFLQHGGHRIEGRHRAQDVISDAHVNLRDDESKRAIGGADAELRHPPAQGGGRAEGDGKQDADGQGRQQNREQQDTLPPEAFAGAGAGDVNGRGGPGEEHDSHSQRGQAQ